MKTAPIPPDFEAEMFPFGPVQPDPENRREAPILLLQISKEIWAKGGEVWHFDKIESPAGCVFRANINRRQFRVFVPMLGNEHPVPPLEKGSPVHLVSTLPALREWLASLVA